MYYVVTGAAGFIGSNIVRALNDRGENRVIAVDNLTRGDKFRNLARRTIADYFDKAEFLHLIEEDRLDAPIAAVFHQGACSDTVESDGRYMMQNNYRYSVALLDFCQERDIPLIYASSAAVYGPGPQFRERPPCERPLNVYGYSKLAFDQHVRQRRDELMAQVVGLRYFNVYGPGEAHKGRMASVAWHLYNQLLSGGKMRLFRGSGGYGDGEQMRDFVSVDDVVQVNLGFLERPEVSGVFNVGTGAAHTFNDVALAVANAVGAARGETALALDEARRRGVIEYIDFPKELEGKYQSFTQADLSDLRQTGYDAPFADVDKGVGEYVKQMLDEGG